MVKLSKAANLLGVTKVTLWNWKARGLLEFKKVGNLNYIDQETLDRLLGKKINVESRVVIYARVSSPQNKTNLETQVERLKNYCSARGYQVTKIIQEFGSGLNDKRPKLERLLLEDEFDVIVVEHKDRLTRFGFNYIETILKTKNKTIDVVNREEGEKEDLIQDFVSVITSFCARVYGKRKSKRNTEKIIKDLQS